MWKGPRGGGHSPDGVTKLRSYRTLITQGLKPGGTRQKGMETLENDRLMVTGGGGGVCLALTRNWTNTPRWHFWHTWPCGVMVSMAVFKRNRHRFDSRRSWWLIVSCFSLLVGLFLSVSMIFPPLSASPMYFFICPFLVVPSLCVNFPE